MGEDGRWKTEDGRSTTDDEGEGGGGAKSTAKKNTCYKTLRAFT